MTEKLMVVKCSHCKIEIASIDWEWAPDGWISLTAYCTNCGTIGSNTKG